MEPKMPVPSSPERGAYNPQVLSPKQEVLSSSAPIEAAPERVASQELQFSSQGTPMLPQPTSPVTGATAPVVPVLRPLTSGDENPVTASDEEVIEKEWVDKAKKIITQTKDDPYKQEKEVSKLQADYLKKRYGKDIKVVED
jgi:hypothetical protein